jgi:hypothetical protein
MNIRHQVFASEFSSEFEKILQREIANSDVLGKCRVSASSSHVDWLCLARCLLQGAPTRIDGRKQTLMTRKRDSISTNAVSQRSLKVHL